MSRITIEDLPEIQDLTDAEQQDIYGAGRPLRRKSRESFPGIVHLELLERREVFSATGMPALVQAPTAQSVTAEMQGSSVEKDAAGNTIFTQSADGKVVAKAVFTPRGQIVSYERIQGELRVVASYQNGKLSSVTTSKAGVPVIRQEFSSNGTVTKETKFDIKGKLAVETTLTGATRQVTVYVDGKAARVQMFKTNAANKEVLTYEETWSGGVRVSQTQNTDSGELKSRWETTGDHRFETTVSNGIRDERTYFKGKQVLHEQYSDLKALSATLANQMTQEKKAGHTVVNPGQTEQVIKTLVTKPLLRETWTDSGKRIKVEIWSYLTVAIPLNVPGQKLDTMQLVSRQTVETYDPVDNNKQVRENSSGGVLLERTVTNKGVLVEEETWNSSRQQLTRKVYGDNWTESYEYTTETTGSGNSKVSKTFISMSSFRKNGALERREWFNTNGITQRYYYQTEKGQLRTTMKETFSGKIHKIVDLKTVGKSTVSLLTYDKLVKNVPVNERLVQTDVFKGDARVERTGFHSNGKVASYWYQIDSYTACNTYYNEKGQKTEQWITRDGRPESQRLYDAATGRDLRFSVFDKNGHKIHQVNWEYQKNGDVIKRARDYQNRGTQEIQRREWINDSASAYYLLDWSVKGNTWTCVVERHYQSGRLVSDVERAPDGTVVKSYTWIWQKLPTLTGWNWKSIQTRKIGRSCYDLNLTGGFLYSGKGLVESAGAAAADPGEWIDGNIRKPLQEKLKVAAEEARKLEETTKKLMPKIDGAGKAFVGRIGAILPTLGEANATLKAIRKTIENKLSWQDIKERASTAGQTATAEAKEVGNTIKNAPAEIVKGRDQALKDAGTAGESAKPKVDSAKSNAKAGYDQLNTEANGVASKVNTAWEATKKAAEPIVQVVKGVLSEDLFKVEADSVGKLSFNFATGGYYADFEILKGLKLDSEAFKALMTGDFKLPEIDPLTAAASLSGLKASVTTNYETVRQDQYTEHGGANVYFSSKRLAEWAGPGTLARAIALAIAGDGGQILAEAKSHLSLELEDLATWLQQRGAKDAPKLAVQILRAIVNQAALDLPELRLEVTPVDFTYKYSAGGAVGAAGNAAGIDLSTSETISHFGFAIVWKGVPGGDPLQDSINNLQSMKLQGGMDDFNALALAELDKLNLPGSELLKEVLLTGHVGVDSDNALDNTVMNKLSDMLGVDAAALLENYEEGNPIIDLSQNSEIKASVVSQLSQLAIGNDKSAEVTKLQFNLNTMSFEVEFVVHHKFASGSLADIGKQLVGMVS